MKPFTIAALAALGLATAGCGNMSDTQRRTVTGAGIGAGTGAVLGGATGNSMLGGAALGGAAGAGAGYLYDRQKRDED
ncbi:MAG TPA: YMGG-like glycine zipper-containing protein [Alphaproteobacteria bacterium]